MPLPEDLERRLYQQYGSPKIGDGREDETLSFEEVQALLEACQSYKPRQGQRKTPYSR